MKEKQYVQYEQYEQYNSLCQHLDEGRLVHESESQFVPIEAFKDKDCHAGVVNIFHLLSSANDTVQLTLAGQGQES